MSMILSAMVGISMMLVGVVSPVVTLDSPVQASSMVAPLSVSGLQSISTSTAAVSGTTTLTGTVTLTGPAPAGGAKVALKGSSKSESFAAGVVIPAGNTSANFTISSTGVSVTTLMTLKATYNGISKETTYTRTP
jgi:hypothetical protein